MREVFLRQNFGSNEWIDHELVEEALGEHAYKPPKPPALVSKTDATKLIGGAKKFKLAGLDQNIRSRPGKLTLVPNDDKRKAANPHDGIEDSFEDL